VSVEDTGPGFPDGSANTPSRGHGVALANVRRRLELCYGSAAKLRIRSSPEGSVVEFLIPVESAVAV
jgi:sensor histidine kinase YesM